MMIAAAVVEAMEAVTIIEATAEMIVIVAMAVIVMMMLPELTDMVEVAMTAIAAVAEMTDVEVVEVVEDTLIVMREATVAQLAMARQQPPMVTQHLVQKLGNHTEVEATMMTDIIVASIDC